MNFFLILQAIFLAFFWVKSLHSFVISFIDAQLFWHKTTIFFFILYSMMLPRFFKFCWIIYPRQLLFRFISNVKHLRTYVVTRSARRNLYVWELLTLNFNVSQRPTFYLIGKVNNLMWIWESDVNNKRHFRVINHVQSFILVVRKNELFWYCMYIYIKI